MRGSSAAIMRGEKAWLMSERMRVWSGGSEWMSPDVEKCSRSG